MTRLSWILGPTILILCGFQTDGKNIVFLPFSITSHTRVHAFVAEELAKLGHKVWVGVSSGVAERNAEIYVDVQLFNYSNFINMDESSAILGIENTLKHAGDGVGDWGWISQSAEDFSEAIIEAAEDGEFLEFVKSLNPDLIVIDWWPRSNEMVAVPYALDVPFAVLGCMHDTTIGRINLNLVAEASKFQYFRTQNNISTGLVFIRRDNSKICSYKTVCLHGASSKCSLLLKLLWRQIKGRE